MSEALSNALSRAIEQTLARDLIDNISDEDRNEILIAAMAKALNDYQFKSALESVIRDRALLLATEWSKTPEFEDMLTEQMGEVFVKVKESLAPCFLATIVDGFGSRNDRLNKPNFYQRICQALGIEEKKDDYP